MRINQVHRSMPTIIRRWGCNWRSLLGIIEECTGEFYDAATLLKIWIECLYANCFSDLESTVSRPDTVLQIAAQNSIRPTLVVYQIGADGEYWKWVKLRRVDFTILKGETKLGNDHFRLGNSKGVLIFDPNPEARVSREKSIIYYQVPNKT